MADLHERLAARQQALQPEPGGFDRLVRRRHRREVRRRVTAGVVAAVIALGVVSLLATLRPGRDETPAITPDNVASLRVAWTATVEGSPSPPTISGDTVFVSADRLYAYPLGCGGDAACAPLWTGDIGASSKVPPAVGDGIVIATSPTGLSAFDAACRSDGGACAPLWIAPAPAPKPPKGGVGIDDNVEVGFSVPVIAGGEVVVSGPGGLYVFAAHCRADGGRCGPLWAGTGIGSAEAPAVGTDAIYVHTHLELEAFPRTCPDSRCEPLWTAKLPASDRQGVTLVGDLLLADGVVYRWNGRRLATAWKASIPIALTKLSSATVDGGIAYLGGDRVYAFPLRCGAAGATCRPTWTGPVRFDPTLGAAHAWTQPVVADGLIFSSADAPAALAEGCGAGGTTCTPVWVGSSAIGTSRPAVSSSAVVITSAEGRVVAYRAATP